MYRPTPSDTPHRERLCRTSATSQLFQPDPSPKSSGFVFFEEVTIRRPSLKNATADIFFWNASTLVVKSAQAKEDRRKREELKKLARAQAQGFVPGGIPGAPGTHPPPQVAPSNPNQPSAQQPPAASQVQPVYSKLHATAVTIPPPTASTRITTSTSAAPRSTVQSSAAS
ncbi:hypothetical protein C8R48DRAFT_772243 [Suillus tomentosus]|nr:hypothetical protein C8R48DRAFT_772243 [Suillus tomentosus]